MVLVEQNAFEGSSCTCNLMKLQFGKHVKVFDVKSLAKERSNIITITLGIDTHSISYVSVRL